MYSQFETPVALFIYNRPQLTQRTLSAIRKLAPKTLLIVADGPRHDVTGDMARCQEARTLVADVDWECKVHRNYADHNLGCGLRVSSGIDWVLTLFPEAIFLEDDCVPHPQFFAYCEGLLNRYRDDDEVFCVSGFSPPVPALSVHRDSHYLSQFFEMWGWATWRRSWKTYDFKISEWAQLRETNWLNGVIGDVQIARQLARDFDSVYYHNRNASVVDTWDHQFQFSMLRQGARCAKPTQNLIRNFGVGIADATHTKLYSRRGQVGLTRLPLPKNCSAPIPFSCALDRTIYRRYILRSELAFRIKQGIKRFPMITRAMIRIQRQLSASFRAVKAYRTEAVAAITRSSGSSS